MVRNTKQSVPFTVAFLLALVSLVALVACRIQPAGTALPLDLTTVPSCPGESGPGMDGPVPCVWDSETQGVHPGGSPVRWYLYSDLCPVRTAQPADQVECIGRADWTGGIEGEGRSN